MLFNRGMHLFQDLKKFLDEAKHGAIFISLGSNVRSDKMSPEKVKVFVEVFSELPQRIVWKWESETLPGQTQNMMVGKWLPQNDILGTV
jgi:glucuronosyltransferase